MSRTCLPYRFNIAFKKAQFISKSIIILGFILLLNSCSSVYLPNVPNTPMLSAKGELNTAAHITLRGNTSINSAYAVSDHVGILLNGSIMNRERELKDFRHNLIEAGTGYFTTFSNGSRILEFYAGLGKGSSDRTYRNDAGLVSDRQETNFNKVFFQANYSSKEKSALHLFGKDFPLNYGTALRISYVNMKEFKRNGIIQPTEDNLFLEPVFFTRLVLLPAVQLQYTSGSNFGIKNREFLTAGNSVFSLGIVINVGGRSLAAAK